MLYREGALPSDDIPSFVQLLVLIAMDRTTLLEMERDVTEAIETIGLSIPISDAGLTIVSRLHVIGPYCAHSFS